jgi:hypothetical protein
MAPTIDELIETVDDLAKQLKDARSVLKEALEGTDMYHKLLTATLKQTSTGCTMPEKAAKAHALKVTLANHTPKKVEQ